MDTVDSMIESTRKFITKKHLMYYLASLRVADLTKEMEEIERYVEQEAPDLVDSLDFWELARTKIAMDMLEV